MDEQKQTRRGVLALTGALAVTGLGTAGNALSQSSSHADSLAFGEIHPEGEWLVLVNDGDDDLDITGYTIVFGYEDVEEHTRQFQESFGATMIPAGGSITIATGAQASQDGTPVEDPDVEFDFGDQVMPDDGSDTYAILDPDGTEIVRSDETSGGDGTETTTTEDDPGADGDDDGEDAQDDEETQDDEEGMDVDLPKEYHADLLGGAETHDVETDATGMATFEVDEEGTQASYVLSVTDLCNVTQAHIHLGDEGENGPVVVWLYPDDGQEPELIDGATTGTIAEATFTADDLVGDWAGASFEDVIAAFEDGGAYVNVHTEDYPAGEIRGQIAAKED